MVIGVDGLLGAHLTAKHLNSAVRDHFVGVHVGLGARPGLPDHQREMVVQLAVDDLLRRFGDGLGQLGVETAKGGIGLGRGPLDDA